MWYYRLNNKEVQSRRGTTGSITRRYSQGVVLQLYKKEVQSRSGTKGL